MKLCFGIPLSILLSSILIACGSGAGGGGSRSSSVKPGPSQSTPTPNAPSESQADEQPGAQANNQQPGVPSSPALPPPPPAVPAPTPHAENPATVAAILGTGDELTSLFSRYLTDRSPDRVENLGARVTDEVFVDHDLNMSNAKLDELKSNVAKLITAGVYSRESANRVAMLESNLDERVRLDGIARQTRTTVYIVASSAVIGALAGFHVAEYAPTIWRSMRSQVSDFAGGARSRLVRYYGSVKEGLPKVGSRVSKLADSETWKRGANKTTEGLASLRDSAVQAGARLKNGASDLLDAAKMSAENYTLESLKALEVPEQWSESLGLEPAKRNELVGREFKDTDLGGFRYAVLNEWDGVNLGDKRILAFEIHRLALRDPATRYVVSNEIDAAQADLIASRIAATTGPNARKFSYLFDRDTWSFIPTKFKFNYAQMKDKLNAMGSHIQPLFAKMDWPTAATAAAGSGIVGLMYSYGSFNNGMEVGSQYGHINLEEGAPIHSPYLSTVSR